MVKRVIKEFRVGELRTLEKYVKTDLAEFIASLEALRAEVPTAYKPYIEIEFVHGYDSDVSAELVVSYERMETEAEAQERADKAAVLVRHVEVSERAQLAKLKAKYEGT